MNTLDGKLNDALKQQKISDKLFFDNSLIKQVTPESVYALIDNMDRFVDLFDGYNTNENVVDEKFCLHHRFKEIKNIIGSIKNKYLLAKINYYESEFILEGRESIEKFKTSVTYFVDYIIDNRIESSGSARFIMPLMKLITHKYYGSNLDVEIKNRLDDCIKKLYNLDKTCYLGWLKNTKLNDEKLKKLLNPIIKNFDNEINGIPTLGLLPLLYLIYNNSKCFNINLNHLDVITTRVRNKIEPNVCNRLDYFGILKKCVENIIPATEKSKILKKKLDEMIEDEHLIRSKSFSNFDIPIVTDEIQSHISAVKERLSSAIHKIGNNLDEALKLLFVVFQDECSEWLGCLNMKTEFSSKDLFNTWCIKDNLIDKNLSGAESKKQDIINICFNNICSATNEIFDELIKFINLNSEAKQQLYELIKDKGFIKLRFEEFKICSDLFLGDMGRSGQYAGFYLLVPILEFCLQGRFNETDGMQSSKPKSRNNLNVARQPRYLTDMANSTENLTKLGFSECQICLMKNLFSNADENTAGINIRNDLMHGSLPINDYTIGYAKLVYLLVLSLCI